jgi:hypothetical protein
VKTKTQCPTWDHIRRDKARIWTQESLVQQLVRLTPLLYSLAWTAKCIWGYKTKCTWRGQVTKTLRRQKILFITQNINNYFSFFKILAFNSLPNSLVPPPTYLLNLPTFLYLLHHSLRISYQCHSPRISSIIPSSLLYLCLPIQTVHTRESLCVIL